MLANVVLLSLAAAVLIRAVGKTVGPSPADLLFPVLLLHFGHFWFWLFGYYVTLSLPFAALVGLMTLAVRCRDGGEMKCGWIAGCLLLVVMTGGWYGVPVVPFVMGWIGLLAWRTWRSTRRPLLALSLLVLPAVAVAYAVYCAVELSHLPSNRPPLDFGQFGHALWNGFGLALGPGLSLESGNVVGAVVFGATLLAAGRLAWVAATEPVERTRAAGLAALLFASAAVMAAIAVGRGGFPLRTSMAPALLGAIVVVILRVYPFRTVPRTFAVLAAAVAVVTASTNWSFGLAWGRVHRDHHRVLYEDIRSGMPIGYVADRHADWFLTDQSMPVERVTARMKAMREARVGWFAGLQADPDVVELPTKYSGTAFPPHDGMQAHIPGPPGPVVGVRLSFESETPANEIAGVVEWRSVGPNRGGRHEGYFVRTLGPDRGSTLVWVNDYPDGLVIHLTQQSASVRLVGVTWLVAVHNDP